ncbi:hypothetical protein ACEWY4_022751 [Coilia grayii]|uniref:L27 domain-containing protein n=1 Tax=Coilia grayii TaxID=363190 RepID=A0ABD1J4L0_9TELE
MATTEGLQQDSENMAMTDMTQRGQQDGLTQVLADVLEEVRLSISRDVSGADLLHSLLSAPWLRSLLKVYECLLLNKTSVPTPHLPYSSGLSQEVMANLREVTTPTPEIQELYRLLEKPHVQALLLTHDTVAKRDYDPVLPPMPPHMPEDEEAVRIVCMAKNKQPLTPSPSSCPSPSQSPQQTPSHTPTHAPSPASSHVTPQQPSPSPSSSSPSPSQPPPAATVTTATPPQTPPQTPKVRVRHRWDNLRRYTMEKLATSKILSLTDGCSMDQLGPGASAAGLPLAVPVQKCLLVQYDPAGNQLCYQTCELMGAGLAQSAPNVYAPALIDNVMVDGSNRDTPKPSGSLSPPQKKPRPGAKRHPPLRQRSATVPSSPQSPPSASSSTRHRGKPPNLPPISKRGSVQSQTAPSSPGPHQHTSGGDGGGGGGSGGRTPATSRVPKQRSLDERCSTERRGGGGAGGTGADVATAAGAGGALEEDARALRLLSEVVSKLQGLVVASKSPHSGRADRAKLPVPPPRAKSKAKPAGQTHTHTALTHSPRPGREHKEPKEHKDSKEHKELKDCKELKEHRQLKGTKELKDCKELKEHKELKDRKEQQELKECKDPSKSKRPVTESPAPTRFHFSMSSSSSSSSVSSLSSRSPSLPRRSSMRKMTSLLPTSPQRRVYLESLTPFNGLSSALPLPLPVSRSIDDYETFGCLFTRKKKAKKKK